MRSTLDVLAPIGAPHLARAKQLINDDGDCRQAITEIETSLRLNEAPSAAHLAHFALGGCKGMIGDLDGDEAEANLILRSFPDHAYLGHLLLVGVYWERGDLDSALDETRAWKAAGAKAPADWMSPIDFRKGAEPVETKLLMIQDFRAFESARDLGDCDRAKSVAQQMMARKAYGNLDFVPHGTHVAKLRRGGLGELAGLVEGDRIVSIAGTRVSNESDLWNLASEGLWDRYGETIPVEIARRVSSQEGASPGAATDRPLTLQAKMVFPELETAKRYLAGPPSASTQSCIARSGKPGDVIAPRLLVLEPHARDLVLRPTVAEGNVHFEVLASDDDEVRLVELNGQAARPTAPTRLEETFLPGHVRKFVLDLRAPNKPQKVRVRAVDATGNQTEMVVETKPPSRSASATGPLYRRSVAVVVGVNRYRSAPPLEYAVADARSLANRLRTLGFDRVTELYDEEATRGGILRVLTEDLAKTLGPDDRLLVFFAGHGETETIPGTDVPEGYLIPVDASTKNFQGTGISMTQVHALVRQIQARQILLAFDSCYSGLGLRRSLGGDLSRTLAGKPARQILTAGGKDEQAAEQNGHGLFTRFLLAGLEGEADSNRDGYVTGSELGLFVREHVYEASRHQQTPAFGLLDGEGDFVFDL